MRALYITGSCLIKNTSANMSHNGYIQGLIENGVDVDIIMAKDSWGETDPAFSLRTQARYYIYDSVSFKDLIKNKAKKGFDKTVIETNAQPDTANISAQKKTMNLRGLAKKIFYTLFPNDPLYPLEEKWLKTACRFKNNKEYDLVISNSSPAASHKLVSILKNKKSIKCKKWIQIWEDPWYYDLYGGHTKAQLEEEHRLLREGDVIYYVSPLTLMYQKRHFPDCAEKMNFIPLPAFDYTFEKQIRYTNDSFGYFGDYYTQTRNLEPFYKAAKKTGVHAYIIGDTNLKLQSDDRIKILSRITLDELSKYQKETYALVNLCNLKGGQIPGKIYHYSVTRHPILFILDGTDEEKEQIRKYFSKFDRYIFCDNDEDSIASSIQKIICTNGIENKPVEDFYPKSIIKQLLKETA